MAVSNTATSTRPTTFFAKRTSKAPMSKSRKQSLLIQLGWHVYNKVRTRIARDCDMMCTYCSRDVVTGQFGGKRLATIDHKIPLSRGGSWKRYNLTCACKRCNELKGNMTAEEFLGMPGYLRELDAA
jgi:5-methylcytosine-specific restriction endonuclease McrA